MKKISTFDLYPGMILGEDVLNYERQTILAKGTELTDTLISRIELNGVLEVYIVEKTEDGSTESVDTTVEAPSSETDTSNNDSPDRHATYADRIKNSPDFKKFKEDYDNITTGFKFKINEMVDKNVQIDTKDLLKEPLQLISSSGSSSNTLDMLHNMRDYDDLTFAHSMNVALLNYVAAGWLNWSAEDKELAMACGLLHDIGKLQISHEVLTKPGKLDNVEYKHIQQHPIFGYQLLKDRVNVHIMNSALMHHERYDGTGYPLKIKGESIDRFARLTAISDVYDAMTAARCYRGPLCPFRVIEIFEDEGFDKYDVQYVLSFLSNVGNTYVRNSCILSDGREGEIIMLNPGKLSRPVVQCGYEYVDLSKTSDLRIEALK